MTGSTGLCRYLPPFCLSLTFLAPALPVAAQGYFDIVDVPVVNVDVVVTDRRNRPFVDLQLEDFTLLIDGQEQEISFFSPPQISVGGREVVGEPADLILLFDNNGVGTQARNAVIAQLRQFIDQSVEPNLRIMVASVGLSGLEVHQELTSDLEEVDTALSLVADTVARDRHVADYEVLLLEIQRLAGVRDPTQSQLRMRAMTLISQIQAFSDRARQEAEVTGGHLWQMVEGLAGLPTRKAVLLVGGAMSINPGEALNSALREALTRTADVGAHQVAADLPAGISAGNAEAVEALSQAASVHQVALYSIVVGGARRTVSGVGSAGSMDTNDSSATDSSASWAPGVDFRNRNETQTALQILAAATGGFVHTSRRNLPVALGRLKGDFGSAYSLGFHPAGGSDGQVHKIVVQVAGKRLRIRHRKRFQVQGWDQETVARVRSSLYFGDLANPLEVGLEARLPQSTAEGKLRVPLTLQIPLASIALEPVESTHRGQLTVFMTSGGERFRAEPVHKTILPVTLSNDELQGAMGRVAEYRLDLEVPKGARQIAVGVRDDLDLVLSTLRFALPSDQVVRLPAGRKAGPDGRLQTTDTAVLRLPTAALVMSGQTGGPIGLSIVGTLEQVSEELWRVPIEVQLELGRDGGPARLDLFAYALRVGGSTAAKVSQVVSLEDEATTLVPLELAAGRYMIRVAVRDRESVAFGVTGMAVEIPGAGIDRARWSSSSPAEDLPEVPISPRREVAEPSDLQLTRDEATAGYRQVAEDLAAGNEAAARETLRAMEMKAVGSGSPRALVDLARMEERVLMGLAMGEWNRLLPVAVLYGEMIESYRRSRSARLSEHAILMSTEIAEEMARQAKSPEDREEAAGILTSLAGYLLYSQRLAGTEELLVLAVKKDPESRSALMALAATRELQGDYPRAVAVLESLLEVDPESGEGRLRLAVNLARTGHPAKALSLLEGLAERETDSWVAQIAAQEAARIVVGQADPRRAIQILERAADRWPDQPSLRVQLAWLLDLSSQPEVANEWIERLLKDATRAEDSARYRYLNWYTTGMEETRAWLMQRARERAEVWSP